MSKSKVEKYLKTRNKVDNIFGIFVALALLVYPVVAMCTLFNVLSEQTIKTIAYVDIGFLLIIATIVSIINAIISSNIKTFLTNKVNMWSKKFGFNFEVDKVTEIEGEDVLFYNIYITSFITPEVNEILNKELSDTKSIFEKYSKNDIVFSICQPT